ncbi:hypothetical protein [Candidatus Lariskella endosymbiont of Epinotia ramella]|uniref:hypothetical protein n=1 Tax=Candidatus Lariskella endosymbiont of Epinotia ramella TaxID=3066224 RepID=UPI0030CBD266
MLKTKISNRLLLEVIKPAEDALAVDGADREKQCEIISFILRITQENADNLYSLNIQNYAKNIENEVEILYKEHASALSDGMFNVYEQLANWAIYVGLKNNFNPNNIAIEYPKQFEDFTNYITVEILRSLGNTQQDTSMINMGVQYMSGIYAFHSLFSQFNKLRSEINNKIPNDINELYEIENASVLKEEEIEEIEEIFYVYLNQEYEQYNLEFITDNILHAQTFEYFAAHMPKICHFINKVSGKHICEEYSLTLVSASLHFFASVFH